MPLVGKYFIVLFLSIISMIVVLRNPAEVPNVRVEGPDNVCSTVACNETAAQILFNMDTDVNPCDNFYKFSCGGYIKKTRIPDDKQVVGHLYGMYDEIYEQMRTALEEPSSPSEPRYIRMVKNYYGSCMNKAAIEERGLAPLKKKLKELSGWPVLEGHEWNESHFDWVNSIHKFEGAGFRNRNFFNLFIAADSENNTKKLLTIHPPSVQNYLTKGMNNAKVKAYYDFMVDIAVMLGAPRDNATSELKQVLDLKIKLAEIVSPIEEIRNQSLLYNPMTVKELSEKYPSITWKEFLNNILAPHATINDDEIVIVSSPKIVSDVIELMNKIPKRVQANYAIWQAVESTIPYLNEEMTTRRSQYEMELSGTVYLEPRWEKCLMRTYSILAVHALYAKKFFNQAAKKNGMEIVADIMSESQKVLQALDWMDDETRANALNKAAAMSSFVGCPDELFNDTIVDRGFKNLDFNEDNYLENELSRTRYEVNETYRRFRKSEEDDRWRDRALIAVPNGEYQTLTNSIDIKAGILQGVYFDADRPKYMNYGGIGSLIGHEIFHGFDNEGRQYDGQGNLRNWWTPVTDEKFRQKAQCIVDQYSNYTAEEIGKKLNGFNTQDENIADNGGYKTAYAAYRNWAEKNEKEQSLPGLEYNSQQMFWISGATIWCSKFRKEYLENFVAGDNHSPQEFRILGAFSNLPEFASDFNCPIGSKMNPKNKCTFW